MSRMLNVDEMMAALYVLHHSRFESFKQSLEALGQEIADTLADTLDIENGRCEWWDGGTLTGFTPKTKEQPLPDVIAEYDTEGDWVPRALGTGRIKDSDDR
jgi:hypothetical protein